MNAIEFVNERTRQKTFGNPCKRCKNSYDDVSEGWNCRKYDEIVTLPSGRQLNLFGKACDTAFEKDCKGTGFSKSPIWFFKQLTFGEQIAFCMIVDMVVSAAIVLVHFRLK